MAGGDERPAPGAPRRLRVVSYNIHGCKGGDRRHDVERIAAVLQEIDANVVGLQEIHSSPTDER